LDRWWIRNAAISCAFASGALVAGPGVAGIALARADLFGIDFFGHDDKSGMHHPRPGSGAGAESAGTVARTVAAEPPTARIGSAPENVATPEAAAAGTLAAVPENVSAVTTQGGGGVPRANTTGRAASLPTVATAPSARSVIVRRPPREAAPSSTAPAPALPDTPAFIPLAAPPPESAEPEGRPAPAGPPAPLAPKTKDLLAPGGSGGARVPDSYRAGYAEHLRTADTSDILAAALPGVAGIAGFTLVGAYAGYRQAKGLQQALLAPAPTTILL